MSTSGALTLNYYLPKPNANSSLHDHRRTSAYHPSIWKDYFLQYASEFKELDYKTEPQIDELKKQVSKMLTSTSEKPLAKLDLIDSICRLGIHYHFECEIDEVMQQIHKSYVQNGEITIEDNLRSIALLFRLLRQHGFRVSSNVVNKFKDIDGNFNESLTKDVEGMLSLYEASHLRIHREKILEEALKFTSTQLESIITTHHELSPFLAAQVKHSLRQPLHHGLPRWEARHYISIYQQHPNQNEVLLTLAKLDFNYLQKLHKKEVGNLTKWWEELDVSRKLPYARDRIVECCSWILAVYFEPKYYQARILLTQTIALLSIIDDTYDNYGTIDELELFTMAIDRWDACYLDDLPEYMKIIYRALLGAFEKAKQQVVKEGRGYSIDYGINEFKKTVKAYMTEAKWFKSNYVAKSEEYLQTCTRSTTYPLLTTTCFIGMGDMATEDVFKWVTNEPKIVTASAIVCRLMDDIVSNEFEQKRGHVASFLECYMKEYDVSREEAIKEAEKRVSDAWKDIHEECLMPTKVPMIFLIRSLNMTRFISVMYKNQDNYTHAHGIMKKYIEDLLIDPVPI
ncbi:hypothetical protein HN51_011290 [Arachis hypogaea]|uniref:Uncharacterized protein n=1 Tax=Arachis hypogaea TaxID=3818 RepID=A0A445DZY3_ARAHY|nr:(-)-germacrene D synthase [Arachis hypogaea]QHO56553.1 (-)-germacrene D synthase [Arachis hypogaea]RYR68714.1 hypothetical protein Ahy_A03g015193 [Arachis hypogaea]